jgi:hypothetical protein
MFSVVNFPSSARMTRHVLPKYSLFPWVIRLCVKESKSYLKKLDSTIHQSIINYHPLKSPNIIFFLGGGGSRVGRTAALGSLWDYDSFLVSSANQILVDFVRDGGGASCNRLRFNTLLGKYFPTLADEEDLSAPLIVNIAESFFVGSVGRICPKADAIHRASSCFFLS